MSQRSHMAQSGRMAIIACSAAWRAPRSFGSGSRPSSCSRVGDVPDRLGLEGRGREVERDEVERRLVAHRLLLVGDDLLGDADAPEEDVHAEPACLQVGLLDRRHRLALRLRVVVARERLHDRGPALEVELEDAEGLAHVEVDRAFVHGRGGALALDDPEDRCPSPRRRRSPTPGSPSAARCGRPDSRGLPRRCRPSSSAARRPRRAPRPARARRRRASPGRGRRGAPRRRPQSTWPSRIRGLEWSRMADSTRRPISASGSRMKNWSSASSLATSTARPWLRRPARPHCWRRLATVPGNPTEMAQSSSPMSIPSSSASVAVTPSSSPSTRRRSISRRWAGVYPARYGREPGRGLGVERGRRRSGG